MTRHHGPAKTTLSRLQQARQRDAKIIQLSVKQNDTRRKYNQTGAAQKTAVILPFHTHRVAR